MKYTELSIEEFLSKTGSSAPTPGGGSIAALTAATGAALVEMMANLTLGKKGYEESQEEMQYIQKEARDLEVRFLELLEKDIEAFNELMVAYRLPKETEGDKKYRLMRIQEATKRAAKVPFTIGELAYELFDLAIRVVVKGNQNAMTDGAIAALQARTSVKAAFLNVKINLGSIEDSFFVYELRQKMKRIESVLDKKEEEVLALLPY